MLPYVTAMDITAQYSDEGNDTSFISHYCHETTADIDMIVTSIKQAGHIPSIHHSYELAGHVSIITKLTAL